MSRQKNWNAYRETLGNISVMQAKVMRHAFMRGFECGEANTEGIKKEDGIQATASKVPPVLSIVKNPSDSD